VDQVRISNDKIRTSSAFQKKTLKNRHFVRDLDEMLTNLRKNIYWGYGLGNFGYGVISQVVASYLMFYATAVLGINGALVGMIVSLGVIWDAVSDPIMGYLSDQTRSKRFGRRHLYLWVGGIGIAVVNTLLWFILPGMSLLAKMISLATWIFFLKTFLTIYITPYTALSAELTEGYEERTKLQAIKTAFFLLGIFFSAALSLIIFFRPTAEYPMGQLNPAGYQSMGMVTSALMLGSMIIVILSTKHLIPYLNDRLLYEGKSQIGVGHFFKSIKLAFKNKDYASVVVGYLFTNLSSAMISAIGLHVFTYTFAMNSTQIAIIIGIQLIVSILSQQAWSSLSSSMEKRELVKMGIIIALVGCVYFTLIVVLRDFLSFQYYYLIPFSILAGFGTGGLYTMPLSMIADTVDVNALETGLRQEGVFYGCLTLSYKLSQSIAIFLLGFVLQFSGFNPEASSQSPSTQLTLGLVLSLGALIFFLLAFMAFRKYSLDREMVNAVHAALKEKLNKN
jgi:Na+/melibiose symporter-like transporter